MKTSALGVLLRCSRLRIHHFHCNGLVTAVIWVQSPGQELSHAMGMPPPKKKSKNISTRV